MVSKCSGPKCPGSQSLDILTKLQKYFPIICSFLFSKNSLAQNIPHTHVTSWWLFLVIRPLIFSKKSPAEAVVQALVTSWWFFFMIQPLMSSKKSPVRNILEAHITSRFLINIGFSSFWPVEAHYSCAFRYAQTSYFAFDTLHNLHRQLILFICVSCAFSKMLLATNFSSQ